MFSGQPLGDLMKRNILVFRDQPQDENLMGIQLRALGLTLTPGTEIPRRSPLSVP
jgi:hypothetical protein